MCNLCLKRNLHFRSAREEWIKAKYIEKKFVQPLIEKPLENPSTYKRWTVSKRRSHSSSRSRKSNKDKSKRLTRTESNDESLKSFPTGKDLISSLNNEPHCEMSTKSLPSISDVAATREEPGEGAGLLVFGDQPENVENTKPLHIESDNESLEESDVVKCKSTILFSILFAGI